MFQTNNTALPLSSLNHISRICGSLEQSLDFYKNVLGFVQIRRPESFGFDGAWLFNYGIGIHLLQSGEPSKLPKMTGINPKGQGHHISFQSSSVVSVEKNLKEKEIDYVHRCIVENGVRVDQVFFHDPDGFMIEICNCDEFPVVPIDVAELVSECK